MKGKAGGDVEHIDCSLTLSTKINTGKNVFPSHGYKYANKLPSVTGWDENFLEGSGVEKKIRPRPILRVLLSCSKIGCTENISL